MPHEFKAYPLGPHSAEGWVIEPAASRQDWMTQTIEQSALRCLPLLMATQVGWVIRCPAGFKVTWNGKKEAIGGLDIQWQGKPGHAESQVVSNFGLGILTFKIPWLFRTPKGVGLMVRGPVNHFKDNIVALEGLVETDWAPYSFTMNWKIIKPKTPVWFRKGEPVCMITPFQLDLPEQLEPRFGSFEEEPELYEEHMQWRANRSEQMALAARDGSGKGHFRLDYVKGKTPSGTFATGHRSTFNLGQFE